MISLASQIQAALDAIGIQLDSQSFANLLAVLHVDKLSFTQKTALAIALSVGVTWLRKRAEDRAARVEAVA